MRGAGGLEWLLLAALAVWALEPLATAVVHTIRDGGVLTGAVGFDPYDQMQYLSWIKSAGDGWFSANLYGPWPVHHDYAQPMYVLSGLGVRLGAGVQIALLVWRPVAIVVLFAGCAVYVRQMVAPGPGRGAALALALFAVSPIPALFDLLGHHPVQPLLVDIAKGDAVTAQLLRGFDQTAMAVGLMPLFLLAVGRLLRAQREGSPNELRRWMGISALLGLLVSWLHSWQAAVLLLVLVGLVALGPPRRRHLVLIPALAGLAIPALYLAALSHWDQAWHFSNERSQDPGFLTGPQWRLALIVVVAPLAVGALLGLPRRWPRDDDERMLVLWPFAIAIAYLVVPTFPLHVLQGFAVPLAVLAVRGWARLRAPAVLSLAAVAVMTIPGLVAYARAPHRKGALEYVVIGADTRAAFRYLDEADGPGAVLAPTSVSPLVPVFTGRRTYPGHVQWTPPASKVTTDGIYAGTIPNPRSVLVGLGVRYVLIPECGQATGGCAGTRALPRRLAPLAGPPRRFGGQTVLELR